MNKLEILYKDKAAIDRGNYFLLDKKTAIHFIIDCQKENIHVLGIDGFYKINETTIQPSMENSIDFTSVLFQGDEFEEAKRFLNSRDDNLFFEIVCQK